MKKISRIDFLKGVARGGALAGLVAVCASLASREEKFECSNRCGRCQKLVNGTCALGRK